MTWREVAGLQGFPMEWTFHGPWAARFRQIGNAVPVTLGCVLGRALVDSLVSDGKDRKPKSAPLPKRIAGAVEYTIREQRRNGASRDAAKRILKGKQFRLEEIKGLGSAQWGPHYRRDLDDVAQVKLSF